MRTEPQRQWRKVCESIMGPMRNAQAKRWKFCAELERRRKLLRCSQRERISQGSLARRRRKGAGSSEQEHSVDRKSDMGLILAGARRGSSFTRSLPATTDAGSGRPPFWGKVGYFSFVGLAGGLHGAVPPSCPTGKGFPARPFVLRATERRRDIALLGRYRSVRTAFCAASRTASVRPHLFRPSGEFCFMGLRGDPARSNHDAIPAGPHPTACRPRGAHLCSRFKKGRLTWER